MDEKWLDWAKRIQALSQSGLAFSKDVYDLERYEELRDISVEILSSYSGLKIEKVKELFTNETGYQTPKVDVRGVVFQNEKILMVKEKSNQLWSLPGGFCDIQLSPSENVVKEIKEESGYDVEVQKLLAVFDSNFHPHPPQPYHYYKIFILCKIVGGIGREGIETSDVGFFSENELPELSQIRNTESQIKAAFEFLRNPNKETLFD